MLFRRARTPNDVNVICQKHPSLTKSKDIIYAQDQPQCLVNWAGLDSYALTYGQELDLALHCIEVPKVR